MSTQNLVQRLRARMKAHRDIYQNEPFYIDPFAEEEAICAAIETLQSEVERSRARWDVLDRTLRERDAQCIAFKSRLDAIEAMAREQLVWLRPVKAGIANQGTESDLLDLLHALILDGKEKL